MSVGANVVLSSGLTAAHAEVTALSLAQRAVGRWDLGADGAQRRGIRGVIGVGFDEAIAVYRAYGASDSVVYNARGVVELT